MSKLETLWHRQSLLYFVSTWGNWGASHMRDIIVLSNHLILPEVIPPPHLPTVATLGVPCYMSLSSPPYMRHRHSPISLIIIVTLNDIGMAKTLCPHIWSLCSSVALPLIYLSPQIDISHSCPISVNHSAFCTSPQYQSRDYQFSSLSVSTIYTGSHTRRNQCSSCFFFACSLTLISLLIKLSQAFRLTSIIFFCICQHM